MRRGCQSVIFRLTLISSIDRMRQILVLLLLCALIEGCASSSSRRPHKVSTKSYQVEVFPPPVNAQFIAGAARQEITPPPGYPLGGHSIAAPVARGQWMKLYARAFFLRDRQGTPLVLVSADLFAIPGALHARVVEALDKRGLTLPESNLVIAATHTHQSPGNYMSSEIYNQFASNEPGYDDLLAKFFAEQITEAVWQAFQDAIKNDAPARLLIGASKLCGLQRNRAVDPFSHDPDRQEILTAASECGETGLRYAAVDPMLHLVELDRQVGTQWQPIGILSFFAIHNTAMSHDTPVYSPDLSGYAMHLVEQSLAWQSNPTHPIVGFFNGAEGDISPRWESQSRIDLEKIGKALAQAIVELRAHTTEEPSPKLEIAGASPRWKSLTASIHGPVFEIPALGGAEDGRSPLYNLGCHAGEINTCGPQLGPFKLSQAAQLAQKFQRFPEQIPVSKISLGQRLTLLTVPFEMTTVAGWRLRKAIGGPNHVQDTVIVGLANEYFSYLATSEEQARHAYEGASTIFGPNTDTMLESIFRWSLSSCPPCEVPGHVFHPGISNKSFGLQKIEKPRNDVREDLEGIFPDYTGRLNDKVVVFLWTKLLPKCCVVVSSVQ